MSVAASLEREKASAEARGRAQEREAIAEEKRAVERAKRERLVREKAVAEQAQKVRDAADRKAVLKRCGSVAAVLAPCEREKLLRASVRQWARYYTKDDPEWTTSICRCTSLRPIIDRKKPLTHILDAISQAVPLPDTIEGARTEHAYWMRRERERGLARRGYPTDHDWSYDRDLDLTVQIRVHILSNIIDTAPVRSVKDVLARVEGREMSEKLQATLMADLKALSSAGEAVVSNEEFQTARKVREAPVKQKQPKQAKPIAAQGSFGF